MSIKALVEAIETAKINNTKLGTAFEGQMNALIGEISIAQNDFIQRVNAVVDKMEEAKRAFSAEIDERGRDYERLLEGVA